MQFYAEYTLGMRGPSNKKADKGTIVHKILEICALCKKALQDDIPEIEDEEIGAVLTDNYDPEYMSSIASRVYHHYTADLTHHSWGEKDFKDCVNWTWKALKYNDGMFDPRYRNVVDAEPHFNFELPFDWAEYDYPEQGLKGKLGLKGTIDLITDLGDGVYEVVDWKGLPTDTPIPTIEGWKTMGTLTINDIVFDKDGNQTKVVGKSKKSYKECYEIEFDDKTKAICDYEHLWLLDNDDVVDAPNLKVGDKIDVAGPLDTDYVDLPIDPYVLGAWLGDGRNRSMEITSGDSFIFNEIEDRGYQAGTDINHSTSDCRTSTILAQTHNLRKLNLLHNKHIPLVYLRASYSQRLDLLRGLMDTDGNVNSVRKQAVFTTCNKKLSNDVKELLLSLGQRVNQSTIVRDTNFKKNVTVYPLAFRPLNLNPFLMPRKSDRINADWGPGRSNKRMIKKITKLATNLETQCIMVDSPSNTYLCTKNMIPTHNTGRRLDWATGKTKDQVKLFSDPQLRLYHYAVKQMYPHVHSFLITIYFINDGGAFTVHFQDSDLEKTEAIIKRRFEAIRDTQQPLRIKETDPKQTSKCHKLCHAGMTTFEDTHVQSIERYGKPMSKCDQMKQVIAQKGIEWVTKNYAHPDHKHGSYGEGGGKVQP